MDFVFIDHNQIKYFENLFFIGVLILFYLSVFYCKKERKI
jgi:hypothetical protein